MAKNLTRVAGLWRHQSQHETSYLSGRLGMARILVFENSNKTEDRQPDLLLYLAPGDDRKGGNQQAGADVPTTSDSALGAPPIQDQDIPF